MNPKQLQREISECINHLSHITSAVKERLARIELADLKRERQEILDAHEKKLGWFEKTFARPPVPQEIKARLNEIDKRTSELGCRIQGNESLPNPDEIKKLQDNCAVTTRFKDRLLQLMPAAMAKEEEALKVKARAAEERIRKRILREEAKEKRKSAEKERLRALAAAHLDKTRDLAPAVRKRLKSELERFPNCPYCGIALTYGVSVADHIYPVSKGGLSTVDNMVLCCRDCNGRKTDLALFTYIATYKLDGEGILARLRAMMKDI